MLNLKLLPQSFGFLFKDKVNLIFMLIPVLLGITLFSFSGQWIYTSASSYSQEMVSSMVSDGFWSSLLLGIVKVLVVVLIFLLFNYTFVLIISIFASPFNVILSKRIENSYLSKDQASLSEAMKDLKMNFFQSMLSEVMKVIFLLMLSILAFLTSFIPFLAPISFLFLSFGIAWEFLDYTWARREYPFKTCLKDFTSKGFSNGLGGVLFFLMTSIPIVNVFVPAWATSYFTLLWVKNHEHSA